MARGPIRRPLIPRNAARLPLYSAAGAVGLLAAGLALYQFGGFTTLASPGTIAGPHGHIESTCAQCHGSADGAESVRCERCHDPLDTRRFGASSHVLSGSGDAWKASHAAETTCASCHVDHRGRTARIADVADAQCAACHGFSSFANHPELALVRSQGPADNGLKFSHLGHLKTLKARGDESCEKCHRPTSDQRDFEPIRFEVHCASCHLSDGVLTINGTDRLESNAIAAALLAPLGQPRAAVGAPDPRGRQKLANMPHADPWMLERMRRLAAVIDPTGPADARTRLQTQLAAVEAAPGGSVADLSPADLAAWAESLRADIAAIDRQLAGAPGALTAEARATLDGLARALADVNPSLPAVVTAVPAAPPSRPGVDAGAMAQAFDARRAELTTLLAAISARGDAASQAAASALADRLKALTAAPADASPVDEAALVDRLHALEAAIVVVERAAGASPAEDLRRAVDQARQAIAPGSAGPAMAARIGEIARLLDALAPDAARDPLLARRIAELRGALADVAAAGGGDAALRARRDEKLRLLARVTLQQSLPANADGPSPNLVRENRAASRNLAASLRAQMADLDPPASLPPVAASADEARKGLAALLYGCATCHRLTPDATGLRPVRASLRQLGAANFEHQKHLTRVACDRCHTTVAASASGEDTLLPPVATCQSCHAPRQPAAATCVSCHSFHASATAALMSRRP